MSPVSPLPAVFVDYNTGIIQLTASETIDVTPAAFVVLSSIWIRNDMAVEGTVAGNAGRVVALNGSLVNSGVLRDVNLQYIPSASSTVLAVDGVNITITISEAQRVLAIGTSGGVGGDGLANVFRFLPGSIRDVAQNALYLTQSVVASEKPDTTAPQVTGAAVDFATGMMNLFATETLDVTPGNRVDLSKIHLAEFAGNKTTG